MKKLMQSVVAAALALSVSSVFAQQNPVGGGQGGPGQGMKMKGVQTDQSPAQGGQGGGKLKMDTKHKMDSKQTPQVKGAASPQLQHKGELKSKGVLTDQSPAQGGQGGAGGQKVKGIPAQQGFK